MQENIRHNRVYAKVIPVLGDSKVIIETKLQQCADRVLMPLPEKALEYLPYAVSALKACGGWVHFQSFEYGGKNEDPEEKAKMKLAEKLSALGVDFSLPFSRVVRKVGPNWHQVAVDINAKRVWQVLIV